MKLKTIYLLLILITYTNCEDTDDQNNDIIFYWDQTGCLDPWGTGKNDANSETSEALKEFLENKGVTVLEISFEDQSTGLLMCESCACTTGLKIFVKAPSSNKRTLEELGFKMD